MVQFNIRGALAPVFTPFTKSGDVNFDVIPGYMKYLYDKGVKGILVEGSTGEAVTLKLQERKDVLEAWVQVAKPLNVTILAHVGGIPMPDVLTMAKFAEDLKVDGIMSLPDLYFKPANVDALVSYLENVSNAAPTLPLLYYHSPIMTGVNFNMREFVSKASSKIPNFKGVKARIDVALDVADLLRDDQRTFIANHVLAPSAFMGHTSSTPTVINMFPDLVLDILRSVESGEMAKARTLQEQLNRLNAAIVNEGFAGEFVPSMKLATELISGLDLGPPRRPQAPLVKQQIVNMEKSLKALGIELKKSAADF